MPRLIVTILAALLLSTLAVAASEADQRPVIRVHVIAGPAASGNAAATVDGLEDSTADDAQVRVEVVDREERDPAQGGFGGTSITKFRQTIVRLRIESGSAKSDLKGIGQSSWKAAAKDAAERVSKWLESHPPASHTQPKLQ